MVVKQYVANVTAGNKKYQPIYVQRVNGDRFRHNGAIDWEMMNIGAHFKILDEGKEAPVDRENWNAHLAVDAEMNFCKQKMR